MSDFIRYYDDVLSKEQCQSFIDTTKDLMSHVNDEWNIVGIKHSGYDRDFYRLIDSLYTKKQRELIENILEKTYKNYQKEFTIDSNYDIITNNWKIHYTPVGGYIDWHNDIGGKNEEAWKRKIVFILYLNDMDEGELKFKYFPDIEIMPKAGRMLIMPTGWVWTHKAEKIFEEKYIITGFYYDKEDKC